MKRFLSRGRGTEEKSEALPGNPDTGSRGGLFARLKRTREGLFGGVSSLFRNNTLDDACLLYTSDAADDSVYV